MIMQAADFLSRNKRPIEAEIKEELTANLCRCGTNVRSVPAVARAAPAMNGLGERATTMNAALNPRLTCRSTLTSGLFLAFATGAARGQTTTVAPGTPMGMAPGASPIAG